MSSIRHSSSESGILNASIFGVLLGLLICGSGLLLGGCSKEYRDMDRLERAKEVQNLRLEAQDYWKQFGDSESTDLEALDDYIENMRLTTELFPSPMLCDRCYYNYAYGLRVRGIYFWTQRKNIRKQLESAPVSELDRLEAEVANTTRSIHDAYDLSNQMFENYFSSRTVIDLQAYDYVSQQYAEIGDFRRAMKFLRILREAPNFDQFYPKAYKSQLLTRERHYRRKYEQQQFAQEENE